jgi:hypothetical protein
VWRPTPASSGDCDLLTLRPRCGPGVATNPMENPMEMDVKRRLLAKFGAGDDPDARDRLYSRLEDEVRKHGKPVYDIISSCARAATGAVYPDRYFAAAVSRRLREQGYLQPEAPF